MHFGNHIALVPPWLLQIKFILPLEMSKGFSCRKSVLFWGGRTPELHEGGWSCPIEWTPLYPCESLDWREAGCHWGGGCRVYNSLGWTHVRAGSHRKIYGVSSVSLLDNVAQSHVA